MSRVWRLGQDGLTGEIGTVSSYHSDSAPNLCRRIANPAIMPIKIAGQVAGRQSVANLTEIHRHRT